jgi:acid phosphatase (class A)
MSGTAQTPRLFIVAAIVGALAGPPALAAGKTKQGYLPSDSFDIRAVLPTAPTPGDPRYDADRAIFKTTRSLVGSPRWNLATNDVKTGAADLMADFSCAVGVALTPQNAPRLKALVETAGRDTGRSSRIAKDHFRRLRPFQIDDGATCQPKEELANSFDYPSGHTTWGWTWALILAELVPDKATPILARGRAYGESRIVCGVHNASAVQYGYLTASATLAAVRATAKYKSDLAAARKELARLRKTSPAPDAITCQAETALVAQDIYHPAAPQ